jgi:Tfp pilus assembly protein PilN
MLRSNLSTRPFYNERAVHAAIAVAALVVLGLTAWNVIEIVTLSRQHTELSARIGRDHTEADRLTRDATAIRSGLDRRELALVAGAAREANELIDQRTFSWTAFFNHIEATLPPDVMLTSVQPVVRRGETMITMGTLARRTEDVDEFAEKLEATGAFEDVLPVQEDRTEQNLQRVVLQSVYTGAPAEPEPAEPPADAPASAPAKPGGRQ